jgi:uncharacterized membrane protein YdjX (TVP38/TMEM64 family)
MASLAYLSSQNLLSYRAYGVPYPLSGRALTLTMWLIALAAGADLCLIQPRALRETLDAVAGLSPWGLYGIYLALGCVRGFTLVPATYLVLAGMLVLPAIPLYLLTIAGIVVSSAAVYFFAEAMRFDEFFERRYAPRMIRLRALLQRRELPIVIAWSFFPLAPTDAVCYVCGALKVDLKKCLLGVVIGEGAICAVYIFMGGHFGSIIRALLIPERR